MKRTRLSAATALAAAGALAITPAAFAKGPPGGGGGGKGGSSSISAPIDETAHMDGLIHYGDWVTFNISTSATTQPWIVLTCRQNGAVVLQGKDGYFDGAIGGRDFGLWSSVWTGGAASCTAQLETPTWSVLASTTFSVGA
ncbi:MAG TPA: hypothetical protein VG388_03165 [Solirubrobacteraceae bacterium]|jgi:hypothetical protein|nr:hypothetical protein [Solirubrobacteraceae bacterium]